MSGLDWKSFNEDLDGYKKRHLKAELSFRLVVSSRKKMNIMAIKQNNHILRIERK